MARESRVNGSQHFDRIKEIVLNRVERNRTVTLAQLKRILCLHFGRTYFRRRKYVDLLTHVIEYLLYTRKVIVVNPDGLNAETVYGAVSYTTAVFNIITKEMLSMFEQNFRSNPSNLLAQNICTMYDPFKMSLSRQIVQERQDHHYFCTKIEGSGVPISSQKNSGRCWIFACLNVIRVSFMKTYGIKQFEFSQAYVFFWDKIERSNHFLNTIVLVTKNGLTLSSRIVTSLLKNPIEDGGYWTMAVNIIKKYGLMPKSHFPECYSSEDSRELNDILNSKLREFAIVLHDMVIRGASNKQIKDEIEKDMIIVYRIVGICLDIPKPTFNWYYRSSKNQQCSYQKITPLQFYESVVRPTYDLENKVSLVSDPRANNRFGQLYTLDLIGNVIEGSKVVYNNQPIEVLLEACKNSISKLNEPVWYSCEVNQKFSSELGIEDLKIHDLESMFGTDTSVTMTKSERMLYHDSSPTHAMVLTGFHSENDEITRWRVENSWGPNMHIRGHIMMTTEWFKEYVFEVVVDKKLLPKHVMDVFDQEMIKLPVWDQLGTILFVK
ncbi:bleomycin hydrolase-like [Sipha flava]|uniref:Bleomycin hydrolase n=1 Tax=Sipha flava TaxID=143950 RepID=A0A8B8FE47_9HEMI|nr:bleomycin hydrolase-like [Sipha flava]